MPKGVTTDRETLYKVMASYFMTRSYYGTAKELDMPTSTVENLVKRHINDEEFIELWNKKKEKFSTIADVMIYKAMDRLDGELESQKSIPIYQLTTAIGTLYDKKRIENVGAVETEKPSLNINIIKKDPELEKALYEED